MTAATPTNPPPKGSAGLARRTSASRAVAAVQEYFPIALPPSPLIRQDSLPVKPKPVHRYRSVEEMEQAFKRPDPLAAAQERLADFHTIVKGRTTLLSLSDDAVCRIYRYVGHTLRDYIPLSCVCKRLYHLSFDLETTITLVPTLVTAEQLSKHGAIHSLTRHLGRMTRGAHIHTLSIVDSKAVSMMPRSIMGPEISKTGLQCLLANTQHLTRLDIRGVVLKDHSPLTDRFLADLHVVCPQLEQLRVGVALVRCWEPSWWSKMVKLRELVVGSRREDVDWLDPLPVHLHDDVFVMLRSAHHKWSAVKFWCALSPVSFQQLLNPTAPFPEVHALALNAAGNTSMRPLEDLATAATETVANPADKKKADPKAKKGGATEDTLVSRCMFPTLESLTIADVTERVEFAGELASKLLSAAPLLIHFNITNTHRNAPTKAPPVINKPKRSQQ